MLTVSDVFKPVEWGKSFVGDDLPPGPDEDYYTGFKFALDGYLGRMKSFMDNYWEYGPVFTNRLFGFKLVWLIGAEANQRMYVEQWRDFAWWGESLHGHLAGLIGEGLLSTHGEEHDKARKLLDPVFSRENLETYVQKMIEKTESEVSNIKNGEWFDFYDWVYDLAILNATVCFMGMDTDRTDVHYLHENFDKCVQYYHKPFHLQALRGPFTPHSRFQDAKEKVDEVLYREIKDRRENGYSDVDNILDRLLQAEEDGETFSDEEIHDQIMTLYWAGHDTTISATSFLMIMLGLYPDVYEKVQTEIDERVGNEPITVDEVIDGLPYLEMVMDETLRLFPPAWAAFRKNLKPIEIYGHTIPEGTELGFSSLVTHRLPHLFEQPEAFKPSRMEPEKKREFRPGSYIPFGRGPRTCIGMNFAKYEMKLVAATFLRHFDFELMPGQEYKGYPVATLTPESVEIRVKRRDSVQAPAGNGVSSSPIERSNQTESEDSTGSGACPYE